MRLGPFLLPYAALVVFAVIGLSFALAAYFDRRREVKIEPYVVRILIVALLAARLFFVWRYRAAYLSDPLTIFDIRDGGWDAQAGVIAAWVCALVLAKRNPLTRKPLAITVGVASVAWMAGTLALFLNTPAQGSLPASVLNDLDERKVALSAFRGKPTVINFWATWCPPCQREMPAMQKVQDSRPDVNFVFVNQGESNEKVQQFLNAGGLSLKNVLLDSSQSVARSFSVMGYPTTLFFDASGKLIYQHMGPLSEASLQHYLEKGGSEPSKTTYFLQGG